MGGFVRIVEAPGTATPVPLAHQRTVGRIARGHRRTLIIATRPIEIGLRLGWPSSRWMARRFRLSRCWRTRARRSCSLSSAMQPVIRRRMRLHDSCIRVFRPTVSISRERLCWTSTDCRIRHALTRLMRLARCRLISIGWRSRFRRGSSGIRTRRGNRARAAHESGGMRYSH